MCSSSSVGRPKNCATDARASSNAFGFRPLFTRLHSTSSRTTVTSGVYASRAAEALTPTSASAVMSCGEHSPASTWCSSSHVAWKASELVTVVTAFSSYASLDPPIATPRCVSRNFFF